MMSGHRTGYRVNVRSAFQFLVCVGARRVLMALLLILVGGSTLRADCPRTGWERARRIVPAVLFWPAAPFILTARRETVPIPAGGAQVRVSTQTQNRKTSFVRGAFISLDSAAVHIVREGGDTAINALSEVICVQVARRSMLAGAGDGTLRGGLLGALYGFVFALLSEREDWAGGGGLAFATVSYGAVGGIYGAIAGSLFRGTSWVTAFERAPQP